jgi:hypothetical protein
VKIDSGSLVYSPPKTPSNLRRNALFFYRNKIRACYPDIDSLTLH